MSVTQQPHQRLSFPSQRRIRRALCSLSAASAATSPRGELLVVGPGVLGSLVGSLWLARHGAVTAQSTSEAQHERLRALGFAPRTATGADARRFPNVVFCVPPSRASDYAADVRAAAALWDGTGGLVFTSSSGVYPDSDDQPCDERSPTQPRGSSPRIDVLLASEEAVTSAGGCALRLAGLYTLRRGAHSYYLTQPEVPAWAGSQLNLLHYADAAEAVVAALTAGAGARGKTLLAADGRPVTRGDMMAVAVRSGLFGPEPGPRFTGAPGLRGKRLVCEESRKLLNWAPKKTSFADFLAAGGVD